ncbi:hypothetical protein [Rodentibacter sp. Ppn85]|uniref:hypothetical protein n=1 Tax=Rodentibacter sp. Ppn85 TaxID=1908525 RepID=UPI0009846F8B|nr:hypothetical protein [Rodentibacter sp. Ppn85]OOF63845.1 hypothetical protein BKL51_08060 [Rodentibacter sp. Ppn85]
MIRLIITSLILFFSTSFAFSKDRIDLKESEVLSNLFWDYENSIKEPEQYRQFIVPKNGKDLFLKNFKLVAIFAPYVEEYVGCCVRDEYDFVLSFNPNINSKELVKFFSEKKCATKSSIDEREVNFLKGKTSGGKLDVISCPVDSFPKLDNFAKESVNNPKSKTIPKILPEGTYRIGIDIPAGEYQLKVFKDDRLDLSGFYRVYTDSSNKLNSTVTVDSFKNVTYVTVKEGQYFEFGRAIAEKVK